MENTSFASTYKTLEVISDNSRTTVAKATRISDGLAVILKSSASQCPTSAEEAYLLKEYTLLKEIEMEGVPSVVELLTVEHKPVLVLHDFGGVTLSDYLKSNKVNLITFLELAIELTSILGRIHEKNIMHKDINPDNILINVDTKKLAIIDFGLATKLDRERSFNQNSTVLEGTLQYMSPEQTGRMNRSTDYRTDLYSLGYCFYKILTGTAPIESTDPSELVHFHIAKNIDFQPLVRLDVPEVIISVIRKLTAKIADDRYQSARGLKYDLEFCYSFIQKGLTIPHFKIGRKDIVLKFRIPEMLYGRDIEIAQMQDVYEKVRNGESQFVLLNGVSGIGKTALIYEVNKPTNWKSGFFISGKFDEYKTNIPYYAISMAFSDLLRQIASEPVHKLELYTATLKEVLGLNISVLMDLIPELESLLEKQVSTVELNLAESQNRFFFAVKDFIRVFATPDHPVTVFLDDLQWCDESSLGLINELALHRIPGFLIIGAYRSNEVTAGHSLLQMVEKLKLHHPIVELSLGALKEEDVSELIADTLFSDAVSTNELAEVVYKHTAGNPFYMNEFLKTVYYKGLINIDYSTGQWKYDMKAITGLNISNNVVNIIGQRVKDLPDDCQPVIEMASCIGSQFDLKTLASLIGRTADEVTVSLWPAVSEDIIIPLSEKYRLVTGNTDFGVTYKFQHNKIHQAVYQALDPEFRTEMHFKIGHLLLDETRADHAEDSLIEIVGHLNEAKNLIREQEDKVQLASLNCRAGVKAQSSIAYQAAMNYFKSGMELLSANAWNDNYELAFELYYGFALNAYQVGEVAAAEECFDHLLNHARTRLENVKILSMRLRQYTTLGKARQAIQEGIKGLAVLGIKVPEKPGQLLVLKEVLAAKWTIGKRNPAELLDKPVMSDPEMKAAARLLTEIGPAAYILGNDNLYALSSLKLVNLSLKFGNCAESSFAYATYGAVLGEAFGDYAGAEQFGKLAVDLNYKLDDIEYRSRAIAAYGVLIHHFSRHWKETGEWFRKGIESGYLSGDLFFLAHCAVNIACWNPTLDLATSYEEQKKNLKLIRETRYEDAFDTASIHIQTTQNLRGLTTGLFSLDDETFSEQKCLENMISRKYLSGIGMFYITRANLYLFYEEYNKAYDTIKEAQKYTKSLVSNIFLIKLCTVTFFTCLALLPDADPVQKMKLLRSLKSNLSKMRRWAKFNPVNFEHLHLFMEAELESYHNNFTKAASLFEQGIELARKNEWLADQAYGNELLAKHYLRRNLKSAASGYFGQSVALYTSLGALRKKTFLEEKYGEIIKLKSATVKLVSGSRHTSIDTSSENPYDLDVASIIKTSQAISGEIVLESLLKKMIRIIMMNAGAEKGVLLIENEEVLSIQASSVDNQVLTMQNIPLNQSTTVPHTIINYVSHLKESVVLSNAYSEGKFTNDSYILENKTKSVLCSPVILLSKLYGVIYLENNILTGAFTEDRLKVLNLLSTQMAISLQNALLYSNLEQKVELRTAELTHSLNTLKATQSQLIQSEKMASLGELTAGIAHEIQNPLNFVNNFSEVNVELIAEMEQEMEKGNLAEAKAIADDIRMNEQKITFHGKRADGIVKGMLMHSRSSNGVKEPTNINVLTDEYLRLAYHGLKAKDKSFNAAMKTDFDDTIGTILIISQDIGRVILNLITNAFYSVAEKKNSLSGSFEVPYEPTVWISTKKSGYKVLISVRDNGNGVPQKVLDKIFQPFFTTKPSGQGTGLGLSLSYDIVKTHEGELTVETTEGEGATFTIILPL